MGIKTVLNLKLWLFGMVFPVFAASAAAETLSGTVVDSASGKPLYHVKVGSDASHFVLTDSAGKFSFNTDQVSGNMERKARSGGGIVWSSDGASVTLPWQDRDFTIQLRNMQGRLMGRYASEDFRAGSSFSLPSMPVGVYSISLHGAGNAGATLARKALEIRGASSLSFNAQTGEAKSGDAHSGSAKTSAAQAAILKFTKPSFYPQEMNFPASQSNIVVRLREDFSPTRHDYLTAAEWQCNNGDCENKQKMYVVRGGKIVWTYTEPLPCEFDDAWMLSDGSIVMSLRYGARKIKSLTDTSTTWYIYENIKTQGEIHVTQPLGLNKVFVWANEGSRSIAFIMNTVTGDTLRKINLPSGNGGFHGGGRHARITRDGTMLVAHFDLNKVAEYDTTTLKEVWSYPGHAWAAVKLRNGNVLISGDGGGWVREINRATKNVDWELNLKDLPGVTVGQYIQGIQRLANGNTIINNHKGNPSILEVSPDKKVVWSVPTSLISLSTTVQILGEEGVPENPGDLLR